MTWIAWLVLQTSTVPPTPTPEPAGGLGAAVLLLAVFVVLAVVVTAAGVAVAGWALLRGSVFTLEVGPWQRRVFGVAALGFAVAFLTVLLGFGPTTTVVFYAALGVGGVALVAGLGWVVVSAVRGWLA